MRRQVGAINVEIDTDQEFAHYAVLEPREIDISAIAKATDDAGYTLIEVEIEVEGTTSAHSCEQCGESVQRLTIPETEQVFELEGEVPLGEGVWIKGAAPFPSDVHPRLRVVESRRPAPG